MSFYKFLVVLYLLLKLFVVQVILVSFTLVVVPESVYVSELEFHLAERTNSVVEAVEGESVQFAVLWLINDFFESISTFVF